VFSKVDTLAVFMAWFLPAPDGDSDVPVAAFNSSIFACSPTVRRRDLGTRLRKLRTRSGLTQEEVAKQLECSTTKISRMETVARGSILRDVRDLCNIYGVTAPAGIRDR